MSSEVQDVSNRLNNCDGNLDIQEAGNTKVIYVYLIGAFCRKDPHRESQGVTGSHRESQGVTGISE